MRRLLIAILIVLAWSGVSWGANYYAGKSSANIDANDVWYSDANGTCDGVETSLVNGSVALASGNNLYANGCTALAVNVDPALGTGKISTELPSTFGGDAQAVAGGGFTYATASNLTINANVKAGTTDCLVITGSTGGGTIVGDSYGSLTTTGKSGILDNHTNNAVTVTLTGNAYGGTTTAYGYYFSSTTGTVILDGDSTAGTGSGAAGQGIVASCTTGSVTVTGDCTGASATIAIPGCSSLTGCTTTVNGNIIGTNYATGVYGKVIWSPSAASNYVKYWAGGTDYVYASKAPAAANVAVGTSVVNSSSGTFDAGTKAGGGAYAQ